MPDSYESQNESEQLEAALRRDVEPEAPLSEGLTNRIVSAIGAAYVRRRRTIVIRRFAIGAASVAAAVLLAIGLLVNNRPPVDKPGPIVSTSGNGGEIIAQIQPGPVIVDDSLTAMGQFAADSVVQEMRDLASDASDIGSVMLASLPGDVIDGGLTRLWSTSDQE